MGYQQNPYDKCTYSLKVQKQEAMEGNIMLDVDNLVEGGGPKHRQLMDDLYKRYKFGKILRIRDAGEAGALIIGRRVSQAADGSFKIIMKEFAAKRLNPIVAPRGCFSQTKEVDQSMLTRDRGVVGGLNWLAGAGRPDLSADSNTILSRYAKMDPAMVSECNAAVKQAKELDVTPKVWAISPACSRFVVFTDSSTDTSCKERRQKGCAVGLSTSDFNAGKEA